MTLQASGPISWSEIRDEYGASNPVSIQNYFGGAGLVPSTLNDLGDEFEPPGVPGPFWQDDGPLNASHFYNQSAISDTTKVDLTGGDFEDFAVSPDTARVGYGFWMDGDEASFEGDGESFAPFATWLLSGSVDDYTMRFLPLTSNGGTVNGPTGSFFLINQDHNFTMNTVTPAELAQRCSVEVRQRNSPFEVYAAVIVNLAVTETAP